MNRQEAADELRQRRERAAAIRVLFEEFMPDGDGLIDLLADLRVYAAEFSPAFFDNAVVESDRRYRAVQEILR